MGCLLFAGSFGLNSIHLYFEVGFYGIFFVLLPVAIFITAYVEKLHVRLLQPRGDVPGDSPVIRSALEQQFHPVGFFSDGDKGIKEGKVSLLLSEDNLILLWVLHQKIGRRHRFISRLPSGKWLITSSVTGTVDLSGIDDEQMMHGAPLPVLLQFHRQRLAAEAELPVAFTAETVTADLLEHTQQRMELMARLGMVRPRFPERDTWSYTLRGTFQIAAGYVRNLRSARRPPAIPAPVARVPVSIPAATPDRPLDWDTEQPVALVPASAAAAMVEPVAVAAPISDALESATLAELDRITKKHPGRLQGPIILAVSLLVFILAARGPGQNVWNWEYLLLLTGVLFVHELGHYITMRLFGYRNLRMFFIPLMGAAVSGKQYNLPGWKKVIVSLAGPVPGIALGIGVGLAGMLLHRDLLVRAAVLSLILNGLNLLPILPFDGGWVVHTILFSRNHMLDVMFRLLAAVALIVAGYRMPGSFLQYIGIATLIALPSAYIRAKMVRQLRAEGFASTSSDGQTVPVDAARAIYWRLRQQSYSSSPKVAAQHILAIFESLNARPPGWAASLGLLGVHGGAFVVAVVFAILLIGLNRGLREFNAPQYAFSPASMATAGVRSVPGDYHTIVLRFKTDIAAQAALIEVRRAEEPVRATQIGRLLLISCPADKAALRDKWFSRWQRQAENAFIERPGYQARLNLSCEAGSETAAAAIQEETQAYFRCVHYGAVAPPWALDEQYPVAQRAADLQARLVLMKAQSGPPVSDTAAMTSLYQRMATAQERDDTAEVARLQAQIDQMMKDSQERHIANLKTQYPQSAVLAAWLKLHGDKTVSRNRERAELGPLLGLWPAGQNTGILATTGWSAHEGRAIRFHYVHFNHIDQGLPALATWLQSRGCTQFKCAVAGGPTGPAGSGEDDED